MSEFFLELFSEEMPPNLQCSIRETLLQNIKNFLDKEQINYDEKNNCFSTPNRGRGELVTKTTLPPLALYFFNESLALV